MALTARILMRNFDERHQIESVTKPELELWQAFIGEVYVARDAFCCLPVLFLFQSGQVTSMQQYFHFI